MEWTPILRVAKLLGRIVDVSISIDRQDTVKPRKPAKPLATSRRLLPTCLCDPRKQ
jgi:hypothetical protein